MYVYIQKTDIAVEEIFSESLKEDLRMNFETQEMNWFVNRK